MAKKNGISYAGEYVSSNVYDISVNEPGTYEIWANVDGGTSKKVSSVVVSGLEVYNVDVFYADSTLNNNDWTTISNISKAGKASSLWNVGDKKQIFLNGDAGSVDFSSAGIYVFIIGINHNALLEGENLIHFQIGTDGNNLICISDNYYGSAYGSGSFSMNISDTNEYGWNSSYMRRTVLDKNGSPTSPTAKSFMAVLPSDLRNVLKVVKKYTDNSRTSLNDESDISSSSDYLFLLSLFEISSKEYSVSQYESKYQKYYDYYASGNSIGAKLYSGSSFGYYWLRSREKNNSHTFYCVNNNSSFANRDANISYAICPCFCV